MERLRLTLAPRLRQAAALLAMALLATGLSAAGLRLDVPDAPPDSALWVYLYRDASRFGGLREPDERYRFEPGEAVEVNAPAGEYAVLVFADENGNGQLDRNFIGIPREPIALSNGYRPKGPPNFDRARIALNEASTVEQMMRLYQPLGPSGQLGIGIGLVGQSSPYRGSTKEPAQAIPAIFYIGERLQWTGPRIRYTLLGSNDWRLALQGDLRLGAYEEADSPFLTGMRDRDTTLMLGLAAIGELPANLTLSASVSQDLLDRSGGAVGQVSISRGFQWGSVRLSPSVGVNWLSDAVAEYEFGVSAAAATTDRPFYKPGSALNPEMGLSVFYEITPNWRLIGNFYMEQLDNSLTDSPLVDEERLFKGFLALGYTF